MKITKRKTHKARVNHNSLTYTSYGMTDLYRTPAKWEVFADGRKVGTYHNRRFQMDAGVSQSGTPYTAYGTWAQIRAKVAKLIAS